jgi:uncharacterized membrane protein
MVCQFDRCGGDPDGGHVVVVLVGMLVGMLAVMLVLVGMLVVMLTVVLAVMLAEVGRMESKKDIWM